VAIDQTIRHSRRAVLGAALGGAAAAAAAAAAAPLTVSAADGGNALLGTPNTSTTETSFENTDAGENSLVGKHSGAGTGVVGQSATGRGVLAFSTDNTPSDFTTDPSHRTAVFAATGDTTNAATITDEVGVYGYSDVSVNSAGLWGDTFDGIGAVGTGDWGVLGAGGSAGVVGDTGTSGVGVYGWSGSTFPPAPSTAAVGVGVYARAGSSSQTALLVEGKVKFNRAGRKSVSSTASSVKVTLSGVTTSSYVLATLQTNVSGLYVRGVVCTTGAFTIYLSKAPGKAVYVAYLVIN
jgi:hypothetical protein